MKKRTKIWLSVAAAVVLTVVAACGAYLSSGYEATAEAGKVFPLSETVTETTAEGNVAYLPDGATEGIVFYPGGLVDAAAYAPLMRALANKGIACVLLRMPLDLAVLDVNAADGVQEQFPAIDSWYMAGHSLGGSMAASYVSGHSDRFDGLILLAAYSTADLSDSGLRVLSVYGSEDGVLNMEKYQSYRKNLPVECTEYVIDGGCHAYFGVYGAQSGDGTPAIDNETQLQLTADAIAAHIAA